jgi:hypothetical protein
MHDNGTNPSRITVSEAGVYVVSGQVNYQLASIGFVDLLIRVNGATDYKIGHSLTSVNPNSGICISIVHLASAGDYFELVTRHAAGGSQPIITGENNSWMAVNYLGSA